MRGREGRCVVHPRGYRAIEETLKPLAHARVSGKGISDGQMTRETSNACVWFGQGKCALQGQGLVVTEVIWTFCYFVKTTEANLSRR